MLFFFEAEEGVVFNGYKGSRVLEVDGVMLCNSVNVLNADETVHLGIVRTVNLRYFTVIKKKPGRIYCELVHKKRK